MGLERRTLEGVGRVYFSDKHEMFLPSVTTVLDQKPTPEGLKYWKKYNDGKNGNDYWKHILHFKGYRGTLIHYALLNQYADDDIGGHNEEEAEEKLKEGIGYGSWQEYRANLFWAKEAWEEICEQYQINQDSVLDVECFVQNTDIGYAGQFDMLYIDTDGRVTLLDVKTSKRVYDKHQLQLSAYKHALNLEVDQLQIARLHPDSETWEISSSDDWNETPEELYEEFCKLREGMNEDLDAIVELGTDDG